MNRVAVYGTLLSGFGNHQLISENEASTLVGEDEVEGFNMFSLGYFPYLVSGGNTPVKVAVYDVDDHTFGRLDSLEGYTTFYSRSKVNIEGLGESWIYHMNSDTYNGPKVDSGDWREYRATEAGYSR